MKLSNLFGKNHDKVCHIIFIVLMVTSLFVSPAIALFLGIFMALTIGVPYSNFAKKASKYLLQISVVGLGFGMDLYESLATGREGMTFTIVSVIGVLVIGTLLGRILKVNKKNAYLISSGTAICGGSAIAAIAPVIKADENETSLALAIIFILNAIALFIFPPIGRWLDMTQSQFGTWAAIAIHDTSSVVGAGAAYGEEALKIATTVKLTRALWIIPVAIVSALIFRSGSKKISIPWFIFMFIGAMLINTFLHLPEQLSTGIVFVSKKLLCVTLFFIGCGLSLATIKKVGVKPLILGVVLWAIISLSTLGVVFLL